MILYYIGSMLIFGSIGLFVKEIPIPSAQIAFARGIIGCLFLYGVSLITKKKMSKVQIRKNMKLLMLSGFSIGVNWILLFESYRYTSIANATLSYYMTPIFVVFLSPLVLKEKLTKVKVGCILGAMVGMVFITGIGGDGFTSKDMVGIGYGLLAASLYSSVVLMNKFLKGLKGLESTILQLFFATLILIPYILIRGDIAYGSMDSKAWIYLILLGLFHTGLAYLLYFISIQKLKSQIVAIYSYLDPISAIIFAAIFLGETLTLIQVLGGICILGSAFCSSYFQNKESVKR